MPEKTSKQVADRMDADDKLTVESALSAVQAEQRDDVVRAIVARRASGVAVDDDRKLAEYLLLKLAKAGISLWSDVPTADPVSVLALFIGHARVEIKEGKEPNANR